MTIEAILMMGFAWAIIIYFTARFFIKVLKTPGKKD
jgi:phosphotransferase system  glucose/maltose/N-acetylglucosamine-specific IIC component